MDKEFGARDCSEGAQMVTALLLMIPVGLALLVQASFKLLGPPAGQATVAEQPTAIAQEDVVDTEVVAKAA
jgi:hypothetical protein